MKLIDFFTIKEWKLILAQLLTNTKAAILTHLLESKLYI